MRRIAFLHGLAEIDPEVKARMAAFREGLEALGWTENRNVQVEHRFSGGDIAHIQAHVSELVNSPPDIIAASSTPVVAALNSSYSSLKRCAPSCFSYASSSPTPCQQVNNAV